MAYNDFLADSVSQFFKEKRIYFELKKMKGGLCLMIDYKICVCIMKDQIMARIHPGIYEEFLTKKGCNEMNFTGRPMKVFFK